MDLLDYLRWKQARNTVRGGRSCNHENGEIGIVPIQKRIQLYLQQWDEVTVHSNVCVGSWAFAEIAVDLSSLARHMQLYEAAAGELATHSATGTPEVSTVAEASIAVQAAIQAEAATADSLVPGGLGVSEAPGRRMLKRCLGREKSRRRSSLKTAPEADVAVAPEAAVVPRVSVSPPCYEFSDSGQPSVSLSVSPASHLLVCILLECYDFMSCPSEMERYGVHRKIPSLLSRATKARVTALKQWGWPVICVRENDWRKAEENDRNATKKVVQQTQGPPTGEHRRQLILRLLGDLAK